MPLRRPNGVRWPLKRRWLWEWRHWSWDGRRRQLPRPELSWLGIQLDRRQCADCPYHPKCWSRARNSRAPAQLPRSPRHSHRWYYHRLHHWPVYRIQSIFWLVFLFLNSLSETRKLHICQGPDQGKQMEVEPEKRRQKKLIRHQTLQVSVTNFKWPSKTKSLEYAGSDNKIFKKSCSWRKETGLPTWSDTFNIDRTTIPVWVTHLGIWYVRNTIGLTISVLLQQKKTESSPTLQPQGRRTSHHQQFFEFNTYSRGNRPSWFPFTPPLYFGHVFWICKKRSSHKSF